MDQTDRIDKVDVIILGSHGHMVTRSSKKAVLDVAMHDKKTQPSHRMVENGGALNTGTAATEGDSGDGGDAPVESKEEFPWAAIGVTLVAQVPCIDLSDRPAWSTWSTLSNLWVNLVNPVNLVQNRAGRVNWVNQASTQ